MPISAARRRVVDATLAAVSGYLSPDLAGPDADSAVALLVARFGPAEPETLANRIGLLMQACDATAALIGNALIAAFAEDGTVEEIISRTIARPADSAYQAGQPGRRTGHRRHQRLPVRGGTQTVS